MRVFYLRYDPSLEIDRISFLKEYDCDFGQYRMLKGTPLVRNIEGHYFYESDITRMLSFKDSYKYTLSVNNDCIIRFKFIRDKRGNLIKFGNVLKETK